MFRRIICVLQFGQIHDAPGHMSVATTETDFSVHQHLLRQPGHINFLPL
jgi:hypothetical protein